MKKYAIALEVAGDCGMFADPPSGSDSVSAPIIPPSASLGVIEAVCRVVGVQLEIEAVAFCSSPQYYSYKSNSKAVRKSVLVKDNDPCQINETILVNPRFQILATAVSVTQPVNLAHKFQVLFYRRLRRHQSFHPVCLGRKELLASYVGHPVTPVETSLSYVIPSMLYRVFQEGRKIPESRHNVRVEGGIIRWGTEPVGLRDGLLVFENELQDQIDHFWRGGK